MGFNCWLNRGLILQFIAKENFQKESSVVLKKRYAMSIKKHTITEIIIVLLGLLYAVVLILKNPQPFGKVALGTIVVFAAVSLIKHKLLRRALQSITLVVTLLFLVLGTRSLNFNITNEALLESATKVAFSKQSFAESLKKAETENKLVFVDFYTAWCPPCIKFHKEVLNNQEVASYMNKAFINTKFNLYKGEGITLKETYDVYYVPRFLILDTKGIIIEDISTDSTLTAQRMIQISKNYIQ